ncbi:MAG: NAD(P)/FAD-dependent oxidoreductase [Gammaproteobacteria bacterium]
MGLDEAHVNSYYAASMNAGRDYPELEGSLRTDVALVGGGFTGLNAAMELVLRGYSVALVEARHIGFGCSGRNGGQVISGIAAYDRLLRQLGETGARTAWQMGVEGMQIVQGRIRQYAIECDLKFGYFNVACTRRQMRGLLATRALEDALGYPFPVSVIEKKDLPSVIGSDRYVGGVFDSGSGHLHPLNLCRGEARAAEALGVRIFERSPVTRIEDHATPRVHTARGRVEAEYIVVAGDAYLGGLVRELSPYILPAASYIIATQPLAPELASRILPRDCAVSDENTLLDYFRLSADKRLLFGGRCNHTGRVPKDITGALRPRMLRVFPQLQDIGIDYEWGGTVAISLKRIPQLGRLRGNIFYAQGYSGHGIVATHVAGRLLAEVISGHAERYDLLSRIRHWRLPGGKWFATPALAIAMTYYRLKDLL